MLLNALLSPFRNMQIPFSLPTSGNIGSRRNGPPEDDLPQVDVILSRPRIKAARSRRQVRLSAETKEQRQAKLESERDDDNRHPSKDNIFMLKEDKGTGAIAEYPATLVHLIYMCQNLL